MKVSVVIAAYNERENIEDLTRRLDRVLRDLAPVEYEILFVVEGGDGTKEIVEKLSTELGRIRLLYRETRSGLGSAFRLGFAEASPDSDIVVTMDADLNHRPEEIPRLLEEIRRLNVDVLVGSRFVSGSRSEGIPLWKRALSGVMNRLIGRLFDVEVLDKTSGFRIYRPKALRLLTTYRNNDFAFLPEMLIRAQELGLRVAEAPIHFTFRTRGESKMSVVQTSRSYLALLRTRFDGWSVAALLFLCLGIAVRALYAFPVHKYLPDADSLLTALLAFDIREGDLRVFYSGVRIGALESYMHVVAYLFLGVSREAVTLAPLFSSILTLLAFFFFIRELFGRKPAVFSLLFLAIPSPSYIAWTYMPNAYAETLLFCVATLWLAARTARKGEERWTSFALGLSAGLGWWNSLQTLSCTVPAFLWLLFVRRELFRRSRFLLPVTAGFLLGATPWIAYNIRHPLASLRENISVRPTQSLPVVASNAAYFARFSLPELHVGLNPYNAPQPVTSLQGLLRLPATGVYLLAGIVLFAGHFLARGERRKPRSPRFPFLLLFLVAAMVAALNVLSYSGEIRGPTVRYILPFYVVSATVLGLLAFWTARRCPFAAALLTLAVVVFHFAGYYMPWTSSRRQLVEQMKLDTKLLAFLERSQIRWVCGNYWYVYPLNFLSEERIIGVPYERGYDYYDYAKTVPPPPAKWVLVSRDPAELHGWAGRARLTGRTVSFGPGFHVFLPGPRELSRPSREVLALLRRAAPRGH